MVTAVGTSQLQKIDMPTLPASISQGYCSVFLFLPLGVCGVGGSSLYSLRPQSGRKTGEKRKEMCPNRYL